MLLEKLKFERKTLEVKSIEAIDRIYLDERVEKISHNLKLKRHKHKIYKCRSCKTIFYYHSFRCIYGCGETILASEPA